MENKSLPSKQKPRSLQSLMAFADINKVKVDNMEEAPIPSHAEWQEQTDEPKESELASSSITVYDATGDLDEIFESQVPPSNRNDSVAMGNLHQSNSSDRKIQQLEADNLELLEEIDRLTQLRDAELTSKGPLEIENDRLQRELRESVEKLQRSEIRATQLSNSVNSDILQSEYNALDRQLEKLTVENSTLKNELHSTKSDYMKTKMEIGKMRSDYEIAQVEISSLREESISTRRELDISNKSFELRLRETESERRRMDEHIKSLQIELSDATQSNSFLSDTNLNLERRMSQLDAEVSALRRKVADADATERELGSLRRRYSSLENELHTLTAENASLRASSISYTSTPFPRSSSSNISSSGSFANGIDAFSSPRGTSTKSAYESSEEYRYPSSTVASSSSSGGIVGDRAGVGGQMPVSSRGQSSRQSLGSRVGAPHGDFNNGGGGEAEYYGGGNQPQQPPAQRHHKPTSLRDSVTGAVGGGGAKSLSSLLGGENGALGVGARSHHSAGSAGGQGQGQGHGWSPFATEQSVAEVSTAFDQLDRQLTDLMVEKTDLQGESERLHQRGGKTLKERTRQTQIEMRLGELSREIATVRKALVGKPS